MENMMKLAVIQMQVTADKEINVRKAMDNVAKLASRGAQMVVLPEMFNCPYDTERFADYAEREGEMTWLEMSHTARANGIYLIGGSIPELDGKALYNTSYIFDPEGEQIAKHRKIHMFDIDISNGQYFKESDALTAGKKATVFDTAFGKIGVALCYDIRFPELARQMVNKGARLLIYPASFNMTTGPVHWELLFRARSVDNQVFTVGCAPARDEEASYISYAHSIVVNPWGDVVGGLNEEEGFLMGTIDFNEVDRIRTQLPLLKHLRPDVYKR
ncbi:carbon-nitrogen hydrolase family protein [Fusibacter sp. JL298sf-3]